MNEPDTAPDLSGKPPAEDDRTVIASAAHAGPAAAAETAGAAAAAGTAGTTTAAGPAGPGKASAGAGANTLPPGTRLGEFEVVELIGEGGFGIVYLAYDTSLGRHVALKEYMPSALAARVGASEVQVKSQRHEVTFRAGLKSFINEARLLAQFDHPSLVKVYRFWEANGTAYMVMPYYKGATLKDALKAMSAPPDERWLRTLLAPLLDALAVLHAANCYHRDIAPDNVILLEGSGRPVLLDFGAARRVIGDMTQALTVILKPGYAPIEQYAEVPSLKQGAWSDQYALAALVYFAIVGKTPPPSVGRMVSDSYRPLAGLAAGRYSDRFVRAIDHALAVMPADRPQTVQQFADELGLSPEPAARRAGVEARADDGGARAAPRRRADGTSSRRRWLGSAALAVALAAGAGAWWLHSQTAGRTTRPALAGQAAGVSNGRAAAAGNGAAGSGAAGAIGAAAAVAGNSATGATAAGPGAAQTTAAAAIRAAQPPGASAIRPPPPLPAFTAPGELARIAALADPGIDVKVDVPVPRAVVNRDKLHFSIVSNRAGYLYVFAVDPANTYLQLFPNGLDQDNRVAPDKRIVLPRASWPMLAGEPLGDNHFLAMVSLAPRDFSALGLLHDSVFASLPPAAQEAAAARRSASSSPFAGTARCADAALACPQQYGAAIFKIAVVRSSK